MEKASSKILNFLFGPLLAVIGFFVRHYSANRERLEKWLSIEKVGEFFRFLAVLVLIAWLFVFAFSSEQSRQKLTDDVKSTFFAEERPNLSEKPKTANSPAQNNQ